MKRHSGFTLMELMMALVVVGILAAMAVPSYRSFVLKGNRAVAAGLLTDLAAKQESLMLKRRSYVDDFAPLIGTAGDTIYVDKKGNISDTLSGDAIYRISLAADATTFTLTGDAANQQVKDACLQFLLASTGQRSATQPDCWKN